MTRSLGERGRFRLRLALLLAAAITLGILVHPPRSMALLKLGHMVVTHEDVRIKHPDQERFGILKAGKREWLLGGDVIQTMSKGTADLVIEPNTRLTVLPGTVLNIQSSEGSNQIDIKVLRGKVQGSVVQSQKLVTTIVNPSATLETKGATFVNQVDAENEVFLRVIKGSVTVTHLSGTQIEVNENQAVEVTTGHKPDAFKVRLLEGSRQQPVSVLMIAGVEVLVQPNDAVAVERRLQGVEQAEFHLLASADNQHDVVVKVGEQRRNLEPSDSAVLTFGKPELFITGIEGDDEPSLAPGVRPDFQQPRRDDVRDAADLVPLDEEAPPPAPAAVAPAPPPSGPPPPPPGSGST